jgi:hypothetical protein
MSGFYKGKKNKLKIGQKVRALPSLVKWHASHLSWSLGLAITEDGAYDKGQREIPLESMENVYVWSGAYLSGKMPTGVVDRYGAPDNDDGIDRNNVYVEFTFKTGLGNIKYGTYVHERDVTLATKKSK